MPSMDPEKRQRAVMLLSTLLFFGLLLWGGYSFFVYMGVPVHLSVFLAGEAKDAIAQACSEAALFCRGWHAFFPFLLHTFERASPFLWYGIVSLIGYLGFLGWRWLQEGSFSFRIGLSPFKILLFFLLSTWLVFTVLMFENNGNHEFRWFFEPVPQVYINATPDGLEKLKESFQKLQDAGCLTLLGRTDHGASVFKVAVSCMQLGFLTHVLPQVLVVLLFLFELIMLGRSLLGFFRLRMNNLVEFVMSIGLGVLGWIAILWLLAVLSQISPFSLYTSITGWLLLILIPACCFRHGVYWFRQFYFARWEYRGTWSSVTIIMGWLLISYLALNFLSVLRPFPIGWDDLGSYLNRPRLLVSYGSFIYSMATFQWEYLSSLGFLLFGFDSVFGATVSMMINWAAGLIAVFTILAFGRVFLGSGGGLLSALLYYTLPLVGHFSFADMKIDNAVFSMGALSTLALFLFLFPPDDSVTEQSEAMQSWRKFSWLIFAGILGGLAFSMKVTAIMVVMSLGAVLLAALIHWSAFIGSVFFTFAFFAYDGKLTVVRIMERALGEGMSLSRGTFAALCAAVGLSFFFLAFRYRRDKIKNGLIAALIFAASFVASIAPWILHNNIQYGNIIPRLETGAPNTFTPSMAVSNPEEVADHGQKIVTLPPELAVNPNHPTCEPTGHKEELDRYWGFRQGIGHYLSLPWRSVMNIDSAGYYVTTTPVLLLFPLLLFVPFFWSKPARWMRWLFAGTLFILLQWIFLANGIPWYGIGVFLGLCIGLEFLVSRAPDLFSRTLMGVFLTLSFFGVLSQRFWQFEQQKNTLEYPFRKISAEAMHERTIPYYDDIAKYVIQRNVLKPDRPYLYRVGTFIPYFIPRNLEVIGVTDHQLDVFNCLFQERNPILTLQRLKALGFNSIIFDTNTATIERNPQGTLHQKVQAFVDFLNTPELGLQVVVNDPDRGVAYVLIPD